MHLKWLDDFKRAIIEKDYKNIESLIDKMPKLKDENEASLVLTLIEEAKTLLFLEKEDALKQMQKIKKTKKFLNTKETTYSLDMSY